MMNEKDIEGIFEHIHFARGTITATIPMKLTTEQVITIHIKLYPPATNKRCRNRFHSHKHFEKNDDNKSTPQIRYFQRESQLLL